MADPSPSTQGDDHAFVAISSCRSSHQQDWIQEQDRMRSELILKDDFTWSIPSPGAMVGAGSSSATASTLRYLGGVDVSFSKEDPSVACAALVVVDLHQQLQVVYEDYSAPVHLDVPYVPGFLAFREAPLLLGLLEAMKRDCGPHPYYPQVLMVDGNGLLHPRDIPTIGIGKNLHHVDGLTQVGVRQLLEDNANYSKDFIILVGNSGKTLGVAMRSGSCSSKPVFVSIGHRISLDSCIKVLRLCCKYRTPEPVRQADIRSRKWLRAYEHSLQN